MFTITNPRIVTLIAVVCAVAVAPQALGASSIHSRIAPPGDEPTGFELGELKNGRAVFTVATPDAVQGYALSGFDLSALNGIPGYQQQQEYLREHARAALPAAGPHKSLTAGSRVAAIKALQRRSVDLDAAYRKLYPGAYRQAVQTSPKATEWSFPSCSPNAGAEFNSYIYSGDPCTI